MATKRSGSGLGLSLSRETIEADGSRLSIENQTDGGLQVSFGGHPCTTTAETRR